jgi:hypothetical protein
MLELIDGLNEPGKNFRGITYHKIVFPDPAIEPYGRWQSGHALQRGRRHAYVCHVSIKEIPLLAIRETLYFV